MAAALVALVALAGYAAQPASAQHDRPDAAAERRPPEHRCGPQDDEAQHDRPPEPPLFHPLPSDHGPLSAEEREELVEFLRENVPKMHSALRRLEQKDPTNFDHRLQEAAPLLRRLRRIFERDALLGRSVIEHWENMQLLHRARRAWLDSADDRRRRREIEDLMRRTVAENVEIEVAVLEDQLRELEWQREARIEEEFERLTASDADLAPEPPELRELVRRLHDAETRAELEWLEEDLWLQCAVRMDREVKLLEKRLERMRSNMAEEVDRHMRGLTSPPKPPGDERRGHRPPGPPP